MVLVDAFNVLHAAALADARLAGLTLEGLASLIGVVGRLQAEGVVLVCDGTAGGRGWRTGQEVAPGVTVHLAGPGQDADSVIEARLLDWERVGRGGKGGKGGKGGRCTVVSSDRRLIAAAAGVAGGRARCVSSRDFIRALARDLERLERAARERDGGRPALGARDGLDADTAAYWLGEFGFDGGGASPAGGEEWGARIDPDDLDMGKWLGEDEDRNGQ